MFETMTGFLWAFIPCVALLCVGVMKEEKLIAWEEKHLFKKRGEKK